MPLETNTLQPVAPPADAVIVAEDAEALEPSQDAAGGQRATPFEVPSQLAFHGPHSNDA